MINRGPGDCVDAVDTIELEPLRQNVYEEGDLHPEATHKEFLSVRRERLAEKAAQPDDFDQAVRALPAALPARKRKPRAPLSPQSVVSENSRSPAISRSCGKNSSASGDTSPARRK